MSGVEVHHGDMRQVLATLEPASVDACVTDPPYGIGFMGKGWDRDVPGPEYWRAVWRVLKPGRNLAAFFGTRTYHRGAAAIEAAGFEVIDMAAWLYGSGWPKSKLLLKPAHEPICLAVKPGAAWVGFNTDACRVAVSASDDANARASKGSGLGYGGGDGERGAWTGVAGRWPANVVHDGSDEVVAGFPQADGMATGVLRRGSTTGKGLGYGGSAPAEAVIAGYDDAGSAARFLYSAKADADDRLGSKHPTVKPIDLMAWLVRLVTPPPGGLVLDPFAGTGTTGIAALREGLAAILIELEAATVADIQLRLDHAAGRAPLTAQLKARRKPQAASPGPLFGEAGVE